MNKEQFQYYITNPKEISKDDIWRLEEFVTKEPYCQMGHLFLAKIAHDHNDEDKHLKLSHAAVYTVNRSVLKTIIEKGWDELPQFVEEHFIQPKHSSESGNMNMTEIPIDNQEKDEAEQGDTSTLQETNQEGIVWDTEGSDQARDLDQLHKQDDTVSSETQYPDAVNKLIEAVEESRQLRKKFQNMENAANEEINNKPEDIEVIHDHDDETLVEEPDELRKRKQIEIIDNFISLESTLVKRKLKIPQEPSVPQKDLSLKSTSLNDELVSENLALIMKNQGKIDKAIDIYKKLIWKFPQKKAYFASLIEELKK